MQHQKTTGKPTQDVLAKTPTTQEELEAQLVAAVDSLEAGRGVNGEAAFRRLRRRIKEARG